MAIALGATREEERKISLSAAKPKYSDQFTQDLGTKFSIAMGDSSPGPAVMANAIYTGAEDRYRHLLGQQEAMKNENLRLTILKEMALGGDVNPMDIEIVKGLTQEQLYSGDLPTILEQAYAKKATNYSSSLMDEETGVLTDAITDRPEETLELLDRSEYSVARKLILDQKIEGIKASSEFRGVQDLPAHAWAWAQALVPFWQDIAISTAVPDAEVGSVFVGENLDRIINFMWRQTPVEFKRQLDQVEANFMGRGDFLGYQRFLNSLSVYSTSDQAYDNLWQGLDVVGSIPLAKLTHAMRGATKAAGGALNELETAAVQIGRDGKAAEAIVERSIRTGSLTTTDAKIPNSIELAIPSEARPHQVWTGKPKLSPAATNRLEQAVKQQDVFISKALAEPNRIDRLDANQMAKAFDEAQATIEQMFGHDRYSMVDIVRNEADNQTNIASVTVRFGNKNGEYFTSEKQAKNNAKWVGLKTDDYVIKPMPGGRWTVEVNRPVREDGLRGVEIATDHQSPSNWMNKVLDFLRTPDDKLSPAQVAARSVAVNSSQHLSNMMEGVAKSIGTVKGKELDELEKALEFNRIPDKTTKKSSYFTDYNELEEFWQERFGHLPTEAQYQAYTAAVKLSDLEWTVLNQDILLQKMRLGVESISLKLDGLDFPIPFEGRVVENLPPVNLQSKSAYRVGVIQDGKIVDDFTSRYPSMKSREKISELIADGYKVINISGQFKHGEKSYQYLVVRDFKRNALNPNQLAYNPGHKIYKHGHYLKQPNLRSDEDGVTSYFGDRSYANVRSEKEGHELAERFNIAREKIRNSEADAQTYVRDNLPVSWSTLLRDIDTGAFDLNAPVVYTPSGASTYSRLPGRETMDDFTGGEHNPAYRINGRFIGEGSEVDLPTYTVENGSAKTFTGQKLLSPLEALKSGLDNAVQVRVMNDYRTKSADDFVREFGNLLDANSEDLRNGSVEFLYNPKYLSGADPVRVQRAESVRNAILGLLNYKTFVERAVDVHKERIVQSVREMWGNRAADFISDTAIPKIKNADLWLRAVGFHTKLGLFNPKQLFLQASAAVNVAAIAGKSGTKAMMNATQMMLAHQFTNNPERMAKVAAKAVGFKPEHFMEMMDAFRRSGFSKVGQNTSYMDMMAGPSMKTGKLKQVLDVGARPFNMGEYFSRSMGFAAAYDEWRLANPAGKLNRQAERTILARAQLLTGNMTRQSNARWQKGYLSVVTQFFGAQARLTEQLLSGGLLGNGRLTRAEKARLFLSMSTLYGMPVGLGATVGVLPVRDMLRDWLAEQNIQYDQTIAEPFIDGFASSLVEFLTGGDFTVSEKYGLGGLTTVYDLMKGDSSLTELLMGASGGIVGDTIGDTQPFWSYLGSVADLDDSTYYPITPGELFDPLRNVTTVNSVVRLWEAANIQKWMSRNGTVLTDITDTEALISSIFGVDPERVSDTYNKADALATWAEHETKQRRAISTDLVRAIQNFKSGNDDIGDLLMDRSRKEAIRLGMDSRSFNRLLQDAIQQEGFDDLITEKWNKKALEKQLEGAN